VRGINKQKTMDIDFKLLNFITVQFVFTTNSNFHRNKQIAAF